MPAAAERLFLSTGRGVDEALALELSALGWKHQAVDGGFEVEGPAGLHREACLRLRVANHVLLRVAQFECRDPFMLKKELARVDLRAYLASPPEIDVSVKGTPLREDQVRAEAAKLWGEAKDGPRVLIRIQRGRAEVSVDAAGEILHRRGYRQEISRAPLRETLAAGILLWLGYDGSEPLWDPMCGSGTFPIEAALIASRRAPGLARPFAFEQWPTFDAAAWQRQRAKVLAELREPPNAIRGSDINAGSLGVARRNAKRAGVLDQVVLERRDATTLAPPPDLSPGLLVANLPYGKRVGEEEDLDGLHRDFGNTLKKNFEGWRAALLVGSAHLAAQLGVAQERSLEIENGGIRCILISCHL